MSHVLIQQYLNELRDLRRVSGTSRESVVREAFKDLLKGWARSHDLVFVPEYEIVTPAGDRRQVDGALLHTLRVPFGYWEAKDENDDLDEEIVRKFRRGYPQDNIIFEDSTRAVLIQNKQEVMRCATDDVPGLEKLLNLFFAYERAEIGEFRKAVEQFKSDLPAVLDALRQMIETAHANSAGFRKAETAFLDHAREAINPSLTETDVREMLIQHILTEEIFSKVFGEDDFHRENNVAGALYELEGSFFTGDLKKRTLRGLDPYYAAIRAAAARIASHHEKQAFLKVIYENFYKVYNVKAADRLGVVYTPNEIVRFMVESADWLCEKRFGKNLIDRDVDILDPATGTGTFICELLEHFRGQPKKLEHKYREELHANEVAILPYYVANLNIEATYAAITGHYAEFPNLCFVDTLDNVAGLRKYAGHVDDLFGGVSEENVARIKRQNHRRISVIIGNPPYNANQLNENENNKNREYPAIDKRIKETYIAASTAQKTKLYDMYARFFRWASDRLDENGVLALITNRSFIDSRTFDGFRATVAKEFNEIHIVDLGGAWRESGSAGGGNVFGIGTGVAISFLVKRSKTQGCRIFYAGRPEMETGEEKLAWLSSAKISQIKPAEINPDVKHNWLNLTANDFDSLIPVVSKETKQAKKPRQERAIFKLFSLGVVTNRDEWVYGGSVDEVTAKVTALIDGYNATRKGLAGGGRGDLASKLDYSIKWTRAVKRDLAKGIAYKFDDDLLVESRYRPYVKKTLYFSRQLNEMQSRTPEIFGKSGNLQTPCIVFSDPTAQKPFMALAVDQLFDLHFVGAASGAVGVPLEVLSEKTEATTDNITDWALEQFREHYGKAPPPNLPLRGRSQSQAEAGDSLPQRGRVGVGESPTRLFVPKPLPASLKTFARTLRGNPTHAERLVWEMLRREQTGVKFRRQHPLEPYVLDFYCMARKFAVEIDGGQHNDATGRAHDEKRSAFLASRGIRVLRFWNSDVMQNPEGVWEAIVTALETPPPRPSPAGGGSDIADAGGGSKSDLITKEMVFHYVYAVLHDPIYREKYALNLKREFPRIPFYADFWQWADWGKELMELHIGYESAEPYPLERTDLPMDGGVPVKKGRSKSLTAEAAATTGNTRADAPKALLRADKEDGRIRLDTQTTLSDVAPEAWDYRLGNRSALEWILDQYKEKKPKDPTIREKFNTYRFADYKEQVIDLLARVTTVSVRTVAITEAMKQAKR